MSFDALDPLVHAQKEYDVVLKSPSCLKDPWLDICTLNGLPKDSIKRQNEMHSDCPHGELLLWLGLSTSLLWTSTLGVPNALMKGLHPQRASTKGLISLIASVR